MSLVGTLRARSNTSVWGLCKCLQQSFQEKSKWHWEKVILALVRDLNETALTLLEKDLDVVAHESKKEIRNMLRDCRIN